MQQVGTLATAARAPGRSGPRPSVCDVSREILIRLDRKAHPPLYHQVGARIVLLRRLVQRLLWRKEVAHRQKECRDELLKE